MKKYIVLILLMGAMQSWQAISAAAEVARGVLLVSASVPTSAELRDLPLYEVPAVGGTDTLGLLITGDGGWAELDRQVAAELARQGIPVIGLSSLKYFWHSRTPELAAHDVAEVLRHYLASWQRSRIMLIGYSFGADVLPFIVNRLPPDLRARLTSVSLLGLSANASFEVSAAGWIDARAAPSMPVTPELSRIETMPVLCVYGEGEQGSLCPSLAQRNVASVRIGSGHHFSGDYHKLAQAIVEVSASHKRRSLSRNPPLRFPTSRSERSA